MLRDLYPRCRRGDSGTRCRAANRTILGKQLAVKHPKTTVEVIDEEDMPW